MRFAAGTRLGPYEVIDSAGAGGMGEVYKARDTRLNRTVAIKVLPAEISGEAEARARLEREARAIAALNHRHICALYDVGEAPVDEESRDTRIRFLVMEYLEGVTLAERLRRGRLPVATALEVAVQIASALTSAHRAGIIHRDLKPGNVFLVQDASGGVTAKLLDFGLAKSLPVATGSESSRETMGAALTAPGTILGTAQYMAPEQLEGRESDARTDIFAFGAVIYEMLTGRKAFEGASRASLIAAILERDPTPLGTLQPELPPAFGRIVETCLAKDPDDRWHTARDLLRELTWLRDADLTTTTKQDIEKRRSRSGILPWVAAVAVVGIGLAAYYLTRQPPAPAISFSIYPPAGTKFPRGSAEVAVSPAGDRVAFVGLSADGQRRLWIRRLDSVEAQLLDGTEGAAYPFWSPDMESVGFFTETKLKRVSAAGGLPQAVCDVRHGRGGTWNGEGTILFGQAFGPIRRVGENGGDPTPVTAIDDSRREPQHSWPMFLKDGRRFLYLSRNEDPQKTAIFQGALGSNEKRLVELGESNFGVAGMHLLSTSSGSLVARLYDPDRATAVGEPIRIAQGISHIGHRAESGFSVGDRALAYRIASDSSHLIWFDRNGRELGSFRDPGDYHHPSLSPDEKHVAIEKTDPATGRHSIWRLELSRGIGSRLVFDAAGAHNPIWSPDGERVVFGSNRNQGLDIYMMRADGTGSERLLLESPEKHMNLINDWSLDGRFVLYESYRANRDLWILPVSPVQRARPFFESPSNERQATFSPDGRWIAYTSDESGSQEAYIRRFPDASSKWQVSTKGGMQPRWRRDGKELFYLAPDGKLMAVDVKASPSRIETTEPRELFDTGIVASSIDRRNQYVVASDGLRFLVNISAEDENSEPITVVLNWQERLLN